MFCRQKVEAIPEKYLNEHDDDDTAGEEKKAEPYLVVERSRGIFHHMTVRLINPTDQDISLIDSGGDHTAGREIGYSIDQIEFRNPVTGQWNKNPYGIGGRPMSRCGNCLCTVVRIIGSGQSIKLPCHVNLDIEARRVHDPYYDSHSMFTVVGGDSNNRQREITPPYRSYRVGRHYVVGQGVRPDKVEKYGWGSGERIDQPNYDGIDGIDHDFSGSDRGIAWSPEMPYTPAAKTNSMYDARFGIHY